MAKVGLPLELVRRIVHDSLDRRAVPPPPSPPEKKHACLLWNLRNERLLYRLKSQVEDGEKAVARTVTGVSSRAFINASKMSQAAAPQGFLAKLGDRLNPRPRNSDVAHTTKQPAARRASAGGGRASMGTLGGLFAGAEERDEPSFQAESTFGTKAGEGRRVKDDAGNGAASRRAEATASATQRKERNHPRQDKAPHRTELGVLNGSYQGDNTARRGLSTAAATCDEAMGRDDGDSEPGADNRRIPRGWGKDDGEAEAEIEATTTTGLSAAATKGVTSSPTPLRQEATTDYMTVVATKQSESESTSATTRPPVHIGGTEGLEGDRRCCTSTDSRASSTGPRPENSVTSTAALSLPEELGRSKSSRPIWGLKTLPGASATADALRVMFRAVFRRGAILDTETISYGVPDNGEARSSTKSKKTQSAMLEEGRRVSDDCPAGFRRSRRFRDHAGRKRWYEVVVLKGEGVPRPGKFTAPTGRESDGGVVSAEGGKAGDDGHGGKRAPWAGLVWPWGGKEKKDKNENHSISDSRGVPQAVIASALAATSHGEDITGNEGAETRRKGVAPELDLQLHFIGMGG